MVFVYNELWSQNRIWDALEEELSGEEIAREHDSLESLRSRIADARFKLVADPANVGTFLQIISAQYTISWGIRGDNTPEYAKYLGYLTSKELYPEMEFVCFENFLQEVLDGRMKGVYEEMRAQIAAALNKN